jgi:hypothetical protein
MDFHLMMTWCCLGLVMAAYYLYMGSGFATVLWNRGIWFNENDVLHIGLILWMIYIAKVLTGKIEDVRIES